MGRIKNFLTSPAANAAGFLLAAALLAFSTIGGARAALSYYSENYSTRVQMYDIGVTLQENGKSVSWRNYDTNAADGTWDESAGVLLADLLPKGEKLKIGTSYREELNVKNTGTIHQYVRVNLYKYWLDKDGNKLRRLSPDVIGLHLANTGTDWLIDKEASTPERTVLYYSRLLKSGKETPLFADSLSISPMVATKASQETIKEENGCTTIRTTYEYNKARFCVEAKVDAVQEHNAQDAVWSAWGRRVTVSGGVLSLE